MGYASIALAVGDKRAQLEAAQAALKAAEQLVRDLEVELRVWTEAAALLAATAENVLASPKKEGAADLVARKTKKRAVRKRGASRIRSTRAPKVNWRVTMGKMAFRNTDFTLQDVEATALLSGIILKPAAIRSQMAQYVTSGFLTRVKNGTFRLTPLGQQTFKVPDNSELLNEKPKTEPNDSNSEDRMLEQTVS